MSSGMATARVQMLDNSIHTYDVKLSSFGNILLQAAMKDLNLLEADYFGIQYKDKSGMEVFLDPLKKIELQIRNIDNVVLKFVVKFFPPDPGQLQEEYTRYLFALQIKQDISQGILHCSENTLAALASYIAQSEFGDWNAADCSDLSYLKDLKILPAVYNDNQEMLANISERHKTVMGETPDKADFHLLDIARRSENYGLRMYPARDQENTDINLSVAHMGVLVFRGNSKINMFNWARVRKLSFKKKRFLIKLKSEVALDNQPRSVGDILVFVMTSRDACKTFWRFCIEYHAFFRLETRLPPKPQPILFKRGSTFRYSGKTQKQLHQLVQNSNFRRSTFTRASSRRSTKSDTSWPSPVQPPQLPTVVENDSKENSNSQPGIPSPSDAEVNGHILNTSEYSTSLKKPHDGEDSSFAPESWQVESGNLHSSVVVSQDTAQQQATYETPDTPADEKSVEDVDGLMKSEDGSSPVHLHGGTVEESSMKDVGGVSALSESAQFSPSISNSTTTSTGLLSTRDLKSTSSLSDPRYPSSQTFYIAKEILTTERTYVKDLEVINTWFKTALQSESSDHPLIPENVANQLFGGTGSLLSIHKQFLVDLEERLASFEGRTGSAEVGKEQRIGDLMLGHMRMLRKYLESLENAESLILALEDLGASDSKFETAYREFELQKVCYLPFNSFLLKPMQRVAHYKTVLDNLLSHQSSQNTSELEMALKEATALVSATGERLKRAHNIQKMAQLRRDLIGVDYLLKSTRTFIREGSLYKLSRKGFQQRLFFLFSDSLLYTSKGVTSTNQFKVHAELPLKGMIIEINEGESAVPNCFSILSGNKTVIVAAASQEEMDKWLEDFSVAIAKAGKDASPYESPLLNSEKGSQSRLSMEQSSEDGDAASMRSSLERLKAPTQQRSNATMHVCWHRNTSISTSDHLLSLKNQLSGYLLRKFKNSNGWQKLWVVFTNFCLFFYKNNQDESPLASLPLLGYTINSPTEADGIRKEYVFKLQFKTHVYYFRAESQYTFNRWFQVISSATLTSQRTRLFSRMDSNQ